MKNAVLILFFTFCMGMFAGAQDSAANVGAADENKQNKLELRTVVGCVSKTANTYVITGGAPGPKQFRIVGGDTSSLKKKIGHTVKVVGMVGESDPVQVASPPYNEGSTTGVGYNTIIAQKIKDVYGNCSEAGKEYAGDHE